MTGKRYHGTRGVVPGTTLCKCGGAWYQRLGYRYPGPVPSFYESVPITISSLGDFGIPRTNF